MRLGNFINVCLINQVEKIKLFRFDSIAFFNEKQPSVVFCAPNSVRAKKRKTSPGTDEHDIDGDEAEREVLRQSGWS